MSSSVYALNSRNIFWAHGRDYSQLLRDDDVPDRAMELRAQVASGELFITLATKLDELGVYLDRTDEAAGQKLQCVINDLLYLQSCYTIVPKDSDYREGHRS